MFIYCIVFHRRIYLNLFKSTPSAAGLKALKPAASGRYLMCKSLPCYFHLLYRSTFILLSAKCMLGLFVFSVIHRTLTWTTGSVMCARIHAGVGHTDSESAQHCLLRKTRKLFLCTRRDSKPQSFGYSVRRSTYLLSIICIFFW